MDPPRPPPPRSRQNSSTPVPSSNSKQAQDFSTKAHYTLFIRLPFPRSTFQDPAPVEWDSIKDKALWKLISTASNSKEIDWEVMSHRFGVPLNFLLMQAAWLYERHFEGMRAQMKKLGAGVSSNAASGTATPAPEAGGGGVKLDAGTGVGGVAMSRTGSKGSRPQTAVSMSRQSSQQHGEPDSTPATPRSARHAFSRTPSTNTVTQTRYLLSPRQPHKGASGSAGKQPTPSLPKDSSQDSNKTIGLGVDASSESDSEEDESNVIRSQAFRRLPPFSKKPAVQEAGSDADADEDGEEESSGGSLPFAAASTKLSGNEDPAATLRNSPKKATVAPSLASAKARPKIAQPFVPPSQVPLAPSTQPSANHRSEPLSPRQRAELEKLSPRYKKRDSESSPSIGSSFSDLDDASVTQSALEEALMSRMQVGGGSIGMGMGSRMSGR